MDGNGNVEAAQLAEKVALLERVVLRVEEVLNRGGAPDEKVVEARGVLGELQIGQRR